MLTKYPVEWCQAFTDKVNETCDYDLVKALILIGVSCNRYNNYFESLPKIAILLIDQIEGGHWVLLKNNTIYDPARSIYSLSGFKGMLTKQGYEISGYIEIANNNIDY